MSRQAVREELGAILTSALTTAAAVRTDQPTSFGNQSPVVVIASAGSMREGAPRRTFGGLIAPTYLIDVYVFVATVVKDANGDDAINADADDQLDAIEQDVARVVTAHKGAQTWSAIGYAGSSATEFVTVVDGTEYKRERIPLAITAKE